MYSNYFGPCLLCDLCVLLCFFVFKILKFAAPEYGHSIFPFFLSSLRSFAANLLSMRVTQLRSMPIFVSKDDFDFKQKAHNAMACLRKRATIKLHAS